ncbi:GTPase HflX [Lentisphaera profundi]|uniref:GTPase HflX n=1 Tax=Lentisphaera profundi TaxID=1658616 RepID=A0ABY7VZG8_9BACT|nr:GTPase HflX [Lentisphaera profundi]WDE98109.1 GTPase HflX [Lentisphaera profundi]
MSISDEKKLDKDNTAFLVGVYKKNDEKEECDQLLEELEELMDTMGVEVAGKKAIRNQKPSARFLLTSGKAEELFHNAMEAQAGILVFDADISPSQQRNMERESGLTVIDRREVILEIFSQRATTREARLQIDLARSEYDLPRLARAWNHLSRQRGGANMKGEGERQFELDRRMVRSRISQLQKELEKVRSQRATQRKQRRKKPVPNAAIVGYTNAGKSSLLNCLTDADILADDKLFATLDPTTRRITLSNNQDLLLTDTVGFIRKLPHDLVEAFKATLEETVVADFLIHVVDASDPDALQQMETTFKVLNELEAGTKKTIIAFNKIDQVEHTATLASLRSAYPDCIFMSVKSGQGIEQLQERMCELIEHTLFDVELHIPFDRFDLMALIHRQCHIHVEKYEDDFIYVNCSAPTDMKNEIKDYIINDTLPNTNSC